MGADPRLGAPLPPHHELPQSGAPHRDLHYEMLEAILAHCLRLDGDYATPHGDYAHMGNCLLRLLAVCVRKNWRCGTRKPSAHISSKDCGLENRRHDPAGRGRPLDDPACGGRPLDSMALYAWRSRTGFLNDLSPAYFNWSSLKDIPHKKMTITRTLWTRCPCLQIEQCASKGWQCSQDIIHRVLPSPSSNTRTWASI